MEEVPNAECPNYLEEFTLEQRSHICSTCNDLGTQCRGLKHPRREGILKRCIPKILSYRTLTYYFFVILLVEKQYYCSSIFGIGFLGI